MRNNFKKPNIKNKKRKSPKTAIVTGGARRLGRHISYYLADSGYNLAIIYNSSSKAEISKTSSYLSSKNIVYRFYKCDLRNVSSIRKTMGKIENDFGKIDLLINNAGVIRKIEFEKISPGVFDDTIAVNLRSPLFIIQYSLGLLRKSASPLIINIASLGGLQNWVNYIPYSVSKTALIKLTFLLAKKLAPEIRVNAIAPGTIIIEGEEKNTPQKAPVDKIPLKKYGKPEDITEAINFFINSPYVTGQVIAVEGGRLLN